VAGNAITVASVNGQIAGDAQQMQQFFYWLQTRYNEWNQNAGSVATLTALGFSTADADAIVALIGDMNRLVQVFQGTNPGSFDNILFNINAVRGIN